MRCLHVPTLAWLSFTIFIVVKSQRDKPLLQCSNFNEVREKNTCLIWQNLEVATYPCRHLILAPYEGQFSPPYLMMSLLGPESKVTCHFWTSDRPGSWLIVIYSSRAFRPYIELQDLTGGSKNHDSGSHTPRRPREKSPIIYGPLIALKIGSSWPTRRELSVNM